jgi:hypothetical protein
MPTSRAFAYNLSVTAPTGATQFGNVAVQDTGFLNSAGGLQWFNGPDEDLGYVIAHPSGPRTAANKTMNIATNSVGFWRTSSKTDNLFLSLVKKAIGQSFSDVTTSKNWLNTNGYWTSYTSNNSYGLLTTAWIAATGETDLTILGALNTLESDMATYGLTSKMKALYPMVGGTAAKHKFNFMDARDLDAAYRLVFNGGWTHSSTGALPNGNNAYANTFFNASTQLTATSGNFGYYSRTNNSGTTANFGATVGGNRAYLYPNYNGTTGYGSYASEFSFSATNTNGLYSIGRLSTQDGNVKLIRNGSTILYNDNPAAISLPNANIYIGAENSGGSATAYSSRECALFYASTGLTNSEIANLYTAVQAFQTTLGRQV